MTRYAELFYFLDMGGVEKKIVDILNSLPSRIFEKQVILSHHGGMLQNELDATVRCTVLPAGSRFPALLDLLQNVDAVHCHVTNVNPFFIWAAAMAGVPAILTSVEATLANPFAAYADISVCEAQHVAKMQPIPARTRIIPNGTEIPPAPRASRKSAAKIVLAEVRRPDKEMHLSLADAAVALHAALPELECWIIGVEGRNRAGLKFCGKVAAPQELLLQADFLINLSRHEASSNAVLEAMAWGAIPIATAVGGNLEMITNGENGFLLPEAAPKETIQALIEILTAYRENSARFEKIRESAFATVKQKHAKSRMLDKYEQLFAMTADGKVPRPGRRLNALVRGGLTPATVEFLRLLEQYCFAPDQGLEQIQKVSLRAFAPAQQAFLLGIVAKECFNRGDLRAAVRASYEAVALWPDEYYLLIYHGMITQAAENNEEAIAAFRAARDLVPDDLESGLGLLNAYLAVGRITAARHLAEELFPLLPPGNPLRASLQLLLRGESESTV